MKLSKFDIGAEVLSILTRGMYPDPRDAIREYIQNAVDASAKKVSVKIRQNSVIVQDNGCGMDKETLRNALRIGVSDKNPKKDVGFMGIGIYSSFHLCEKIDIYSRMSKKNPYKLSMDFKGMKDLLSKQKELRLGGEINSEALTDLQTLLEKYISLSADGELSNDDFPLQGTRVELTGLDANFYSLLSNFDLIKKYLREVVPLHFDTKNFKWGKEIEQKISQECQAHNVNFELIDLNLQVNGNVEDLYRSYSNDNFHSNLPKKPHFETLKKGKIFIGIVWGCLNPTRNKIPVKELRGFLLKKQGFAIGERKNLVSYFGQRTHFDRYIGEAIVVNMNLLPNASRNDLEYSPLRTMFFDSLKDAFSKYNTASSAFQEYDKGKTEINEFTKTVKAISGSYSPYSEDAGELVNNIINLDDIYKKIKSIRDRKSLKGHEEDEENAKNLLDSTKDLKITMQQRIDFLVSKKKTRKNNKSKKQISQDLAKIHTDNIEIKKYESLIELIKDMDIDLTNEIEAIFDMVDENFIQHYSENAEQYQEILHELKSKIGNLNI